MGLLTGLLLGGLLAGGGYLSARHDSKSESAASKERRRATEGMTPEERYMAIRPANGRTGTGTAVDRESLLGGPKPEDLPTTPTEAESENTDDALKAANRTRRRARGGNSGKVTTGPSGVGTEAGGAPRSLIGF